MDISIVEFHFPIFSRDGQNLKNLFIQKMEKKKSQNLTYIKLKENKIANGSGHFINIVFYAFSFSCCDLWIFNWKQKLSKWIEYEGWTLK